MIDITTRTTADLLLLLTGIGILIGTIAAGLVTVIRAVADMREKVLVAVGHNTAQVGLVREKVNIVEEQTNERLSRAIKDLADMRLLLQKVLQSETREEGDRVILEDAHERARESAADLMSASESKRLMVERERRRDAFKASDTRDEKPESD